MQRGEHAAEVVIRDDIADKVVAQADHRQVAAKDLPQRREGPGLAVVALPFLIGAAHGDLRHQLAGHHGQPQVVAQLRKADLGGEVQFPFLGVHKAVVLHGHPHHGVVDQLQLRGQLQYLVFGGQKQLAHDHVQVRRDLFVFLRADAVNEIRQRLAEGFDALRVGQPLRDVFAPVGGHGALGALDEHGVGAGRLQLGAHELREVAHRLPLAGAVAGGVRRHEHSGQRSAAVVGREAQRRQRVVRHIGRAFIVDVIGDIPAGVGEPAGLHPRHRGADGIRRRLDQIGHEIRVAAGDGLLRVPLGHRFFIGFDRLDQIPPDAHGIDTGMAVGGADVDGENVLFGDQVGKRFPDGADIRAADADAVDHGKDVDAPAGAVVHCRGPHHLLVDNAVYPVGRKGQVAAQVQVALILLGHHAGLGVAHGPAGVGGGFVQKPAAALHKARVVVAVQEGESLIRYGIGQLAHQLLHRGVAPVHQLPLVVRRGKVPAESVFCGKRCERARRRGERRGKESSFAHSNLRSPSFSFKCL